MTFTRKTRAVFFVWQAGNDDEGRSESGLRQGEAALHVIPRGLEART
jgi:hypothetical protein